MYAIAMYLSKYARLALSYAGEPVKGGFEVIFGNPVRTLPDGATLWLTPVSSWEWEDDHPLVKFLRSLDRDKDEVFEVLFLEDGSDRVIHEYNLRPDEDEKIGVSVSFTFMQEDFLKESDKKQPVSPRCGDCDFWNYAGKDNGSCRLNPPVIVHENDYARWPVTDKDSWCGQFQPRRTD